MLKRMPVPCNAAADQFLKTHDCKIDSSAVPKLVLSRLSCQAKNSAVTYIVVSLVWNEDAQLHVINLNLLIHACFDFLCKEAETVPSLSSVASTSYSWPLKQERKRSFSLCSGPSGCISRHTVELWHRESSLKKNKLGLFCFFNGCDVWLS